MCVRSGAVNDRGSITRLGPVRNQTSGLCIHLYSNSSYKVKKTPVEVLRYHTPTSSALAVLQNTKQLGVYF